MPARVIFIGLDSAEPTLIEHWTAQGRLPALAQLAAEGAVYRLDNCWRSLPTAVWPELTTGRSSGRAPVYFPPAQLRTGEAAPRPLAADDIDPTGFWTMASAAGHRVAAIDLPWTVDPGDLNGIFLAEWGTHDRWFGPASFPGALGATVRDRFGDYPVHLCDDDYGASEAERLRLAADLLDAIEHETGLFLHLLEQEHWDLFACAYGQYQCVGHHLWGFMTADDGAPQALRTAVLDAYAKIDEGVRSLRHAAGTDAVSVVVASHGMGPVFGGPQLLSEVLVRLGAGSGTGSMASVRSRLPIGVRSMIRRLVPGTVRRPLQRAAGSLPAPLVSSATRAVSLPADIAGYIRLNVKGREPHGSLEPGAEAAEALADIRRALLELEHPASGEPIVAEVVSAEEAFGSDRHPDVPDLMVSFRTDLGRLDACVSERVGLVKVPHGIANRTGEHTGESRLWLAGKGIPRSDDVGRANALDVAPTILSLLGAPVPPDLDGVPVVTRVR